MARRSKKRQQLIAEIVGDAYFPRADKTNILSAMIWALCKGTQWEADGKDVINGCNPNFFTLK